MEGYLERGRKPEGGTGEANVNSKHYYIQNDIIIYYINAITNLLFNKMNI